FFFSSRRRHTRFDCDWSSDVCSSDLAFERGILPGPRVFASGPAMSVTGGYPLSGYSWELRMPDGVLKCDGADECRKAVRLQVAEIGRASCRERVGRRGGEVCGKKNER